MRTIKLCASPHASATTVHGPQTSLLEAIRRSAVEIERSGQVRRPLPLPVRPRASVFA